MRMKYRNPAALTILVGTRHHGMPGNGNTEPCGYHCRGVPCKGQCIPLAGHELLLNPDLKGRHRGRTHSEGQRKQQRAPSPSLTLHEWAQLRQQKWNRRGIHGAAARLTGISCVVESMATVPAGRLL